MGRSVSYPANTLAKYYEALPDTFGKTYTYDEYDNIVHDADGNEVMHYSEEAALAAWTKLGSPALDGCLPSTAAYYETVRHACE